VKKLQRKLDLRTAPPPTDWRPPNLSELPDHLHGLIGVDTETRDVGLQEGAGAGWAWRGGGEVVGYSITADNWSGYLPIGHEGGDNVDPVQARRWLNRVLGKEDQTKVFAHAMYDLGWAGTDGVEIKGSVIDVQWTEALLDEYRFAYDLNSIAESRTGKRKDETLLNRAANSYGYHPKEELWRLPARYVGPYATLDSSLPLDIWAVHKPLIRGEELGALCDLEHSLIPLYMDMRRRGVRVDVDYAEKFLVELEAENKIQMEEIKRKVGFEVNVWSATTIAKAFDTENLPYGRTATGKPSITAGMLERSPHWLPKLVLSVRKREKLMGTFLKGQVLGQLHNGDRVYGQIHPLRSDDGGTVTGRLSMSDPNLQFIPTRTGEGARIRRCFLPEKGEKWASCDFSQQEPRLLVHFASLVGVPGGAEAAQRYIDDPDLNYHDFAANLTGLDYKAAKILNLAIIYGRGIGETAKELGKSDIETKAMFATHHREMPFAKALSFQCMDVVRRRGYVRSLFKRRMRFPLWEPASWDKRDGRMLPLEKARETWPYTSLTRARIHKSLNSLIQPSAADQTKAAMKAVYDAGYGGHVLIQVHDELCCSVKDRATAVKISEVMRDAVKLEVPVKVDVEIGPNWRDAK